MQAILKTVRNRTKIVSFVIATSWNEQLRPCSSERAFALDRRVVQEDVYVFIHKGGGPHLEQRVESPSRDTVRSFQTPRCQTAGTRLVTVGEIRDMVSGYRSEQNTSGDCNLWR